MTISSSTDDGFPVQCSLCSGSSTVDVSRPPSDSVCPSCGTLLWVDAVSEVTRPHDFVPDIGIHQLTGSDKATVLREMCDTVADAKGWDPSQADLYFNELIAREELGSTGIGRGFALPHAKCQWLEESVTAIAVAPSGIDYDALDGQPVHTLIMIASPTSAPGNHLRLLEKVSHAIQALGFAGN